MKKNKVLRFNKTIVGDLTPDQLAEVTGGARRRGESDPTTTNTCANTCQSTTTQYTCGSCSSEGGC